MVTEGFEQPELIEPLDRNLVTSRKPDDIPAFNREFQKLLTQDSRAKQRPERRETVNA